MLSSKRNHLGVFNIKSGHIPTTISTLETSFKNLNIHSFISSPDVTKIGAKRAQKSSLLQTIFSIFQTSFYNIFEVLYFVEELYHFMLFFFTKSLRIFNEMGPN